MIVEIPRFVPLPQSKPDRQQNAAGRWIESQVLGALKTPCTCKQIATLLCMSQSNTRRRIGLMHKAGKVRPWRVAQTKVRGIKPTLWMCT